MHAKYSSRTQRRPKAIDTFTGHEWAIRYGRIGARTGEDNGKGSGGRRCRPLDGGHRVARRLREGREGSFRSRRVSRRADVDLEAERFKKYLGAEGLGRIQELRRERGQSQANGREYYSRCAKSLVSVGQNSAAGVDRSGYDQPLGYPLELIPRANPYALVPGEQRPIALLYNGRPVEGVLVIAFTAEQPARRFQARTGRASGRH